MIQNSIDNLNSYIAVTDVVDEKDFSAESNLLSGSSFGQHLRHVLEFYLCLFTGFKTGIVCYDERKRDLLLETDKGYAVQTIKEIIKSLTQINGDYPIKVKTNSSDLPENFKLVDSSVYRELHYSFDHSIHHQALIKIRLNELRCTEIDKNFGIAPSTIQYRKECAQ